MKIRKIVIKNFRCFGPVGTTISLKRSITAFVGGNGCGKTSAFLALSRLFGVTSAQRSVKKQDFHVPREQAGLASGATMSIEVFCSFPELADAAGGDAGGHAVPEFFLQMAASAPRAPLEVRMRLQATWIDDGTPEGSVDEDFRWITTLDDEFEWSECHRVQAVERGSIQFIYVPAARDALGQVAALLKGRLWQAAQWSQEFQNHSAQAAAGIQQQFEAEPPAQFVIERLARRWGQLHQADTDTTPVLRLIENRFQELVRNAEFAFTPDEAGQQRSLTDLSDGQRSLFYIALTAATLEVEKDVFLQAAEDRVFDQERLRRTSLTFLAIEEPENSLSPYFLSRIVAQARDIGDLVTAQVALSSHAPAILSRIDPTEVRYFRLRPETRRASVRKLTLPQNDDDASKYVRLAVRAYPELYFARFVILGEGDSEQLVIPRIAEATGVPLDQSFVPIVPLGGRYVSHFWRLLEDLRIPHATLLDLDLGRAHGGAKMIADVIEKLAEMGNDLSLNTLVLDGTIDLANVATLNDADLLADGHENVWLRALREEGVFFSFPIDIDFSMLLAFPDAYKRPRVGGRGPRGAAAAIEEKKATTLKTDGHPELYAPEYDDEFKWYPYLFLDRGKPGTHIAALARIGDDELGFEAPPELRALIEKLTGVLDLGDNQ